MIAAEEPLMAQASIDKVSVEISVVLGWATIPIHQLLKMGRGAVIELNTTLDDPTYIFANDELVARGEAMVVEDHIGITITELISKPES